LENTKNLNEKFMNVIIIDRIYGYIRRSVE
jgi:hypothetical protein